MIKINLMKGDCLERMKEIPDKSVDMVLTDPPYGTTYLAWDAIVPFEKMWPEVKRVLKTSKVAALFGTEPFSSLLRVSNLNDFKYDWIWKKTHGAFATAKFRPLKRHEIISVFSEGVAVYFPQKTERTGKIRYRRSEPAIINGSDTVQFNAVAKNLKTNYGKDYDPRFANPLSVIEFTNRAGKLVHPTQKPVALLEYLIKTYTLENETVLDFTMGSGSTGVACKNLNRNFIGIERDEKYFEIAKNRIENADPERT